MTDDVRAEQTKNSPEVSVTKDLVTLDPIGFQQLHRQSVVNLGPRRLSVYGNDGRINLNLISIVSRSVTVPATPRAFSFSPKVPYLVDASSLVGRSGHTADSPI